MWLVSSAQNVPFLRDGGSRSTPCPSATFPSHSLFKGDIAPQCSWAPLSVQRKPISQKSCFQQPLSSVCFLPTGHPSNAALFLYRASRVSMHSILQQPRFSELTSLDICGRVCLFSGDADHLQPSVPSQVSKCILTIFTVYLIHFISDVWSKFCRALYYIKIRKHNLVLLRLGNKNTLILKQSTLHLYS